MIKIKKKKNQKKNLNIIWVTNEITDRYSLEWLQT